MIRTIVFPVLPYRTVSWDISKDIKSVYSTIGAAENKSGYLKLICDYENETAQHITGDSEKSLSQWDVVLSTFRRYCQMSVFWRCLRHGSRRFQSEKQVLLLLSGDAYVGHLAAYVWADGSTLKMQGIRSSIKNLLTKEVRQVSKYLVDAVLKHALFNHFKRVLVVEPIYRMPGILETMGFTKVLEEDDPTGDYEKKVSVEDL
jgi:hypothetical protein